MAAASERRVLLIDDDELIAGSLNHYLLSQGSHVDVAIDAASADDLMKEAKYDVVLVDPYLTGGVHRDSREMIESVCRTQPAAAVIVLTGYGSPALERIAEGCHVAALLTKPQSIVFLGGLIAGATSLPTAAKG